MSYCEVLCFYVDTAVRLMALRQHDSQDMFVC